jgi:hypothetical protein
LIFRRYAELGSVAPLKAELDRLGITSKRREGAGEVAISEYVGQTSTTLPKKDLGPSIAPYCPMCPLVPMMLSKLMVANVSFNPLPTPWLRDLDSNHD